MKTCDTCRYWTNASCAGNPDSEWRYCEMARFYKYEKRISHPKSLAIAEDADDYMADLRAHKTFACNQHEPK